MVKEKLKFIIAYNKTAKSRWCKQRVSSVERDLHPLIGDCVNGSTQSTKRKFLGTRLTRNEVKTLHIFSSNNRTNVFLFTKLNLIVCALQHTVTDWPWYKVTLTGVWSINVNTSRDVRFVAPSADSRSVPSRRILSVLPTDTSWVSPPRSLRRDCSRGSIANHRSTGTSKIPPWSLCL